MGSSGTEIVISPKLTPRIRQDPHDLPGCRQNQSEFAPPLLANCN